MPLLETALIIKGGLALGKILFAKSATAKATVAATKYAVSHYGAAATIGAATGACLTTGLLLWAKARTDELRRLTLHLRQGEHAEALGTAASLLRSIGSADGTVAYRDLLDNFLASGGTDAQAGLKLLKGTGEVLDALRG